MWYCGHEVQVTEIEGIKEYKYVKIVIMQLYSGVFIDVGVDDTLYGWAELWPDEIMILFSMS